MTLAELGARGIVLGLDAGGLMVRAPRGVLTDEDRAALRATKLELEQELAQEAAEAVFGPCEKVEVLPRDVADICWKMRLDAFNEHRNVVPQMFRIRESWGTTGEGTPCS